MKSVAYYQKLVEQAWGKSEKWRKEAKEVWTTYNDARRFNVLYSNTDLLLGALASPSPKPVIRVRFAKQTDGSESERTLARTAAEAAERAVVYNNDQFDLKQETHAAVLEALLSGRGILRVSYEPQIVQETVSRPLIAPTGATVGETEETVEHIGEQKVTLQSVAFDEFLCSDAKRWEEVWWVAFRHLMDKAELKDKFGTAAENAPLAYREENDTQDKRYVRELAEVWEVWDKRERAVVFFVKDYASPLSREEDPYGLEGFFPITRPLQFVQGRDLTPVPEYRLYRKTALELTRIAKRMDDLVTNIRANALYAGEFKDELEALNNAEDNTAIPVGESFASIAERGGIASLVAEYPNQGKTQVLSVLEQRKQSTLSEIYEITGIADILRGTSDPAETAQAQRIKGQFGSIRLKARQQAVQYFIRDAMRLCAELVCEHFTLENLQRVSGLVLPMRAQKEEALLARQSNQPLPADVLQALQKPAWEEVLGVLRADHLRACTLEVESSSTAFDETQEDKEARIGLFKGVSDLLNASLPFMQANPEFIDAVKANVLFAVDAFPQSRVLKEAYENAFAAWGARVKAPKPAQPTPEQMLAQAEQLKAQAEIMTAQARAAEAQVKLAQAGEKIKLDRAKLIKDTQKDAAELALKRQETAIDALKG